MKRYKLISMFLLAAAMIIPVALTSCSKEDPEPDELSFSGTMTSSLVNLPEFTPYSYEGATMQLVWENKEHTLCDLHFGAFNVEVPQMHATIPMPAMSIYAVKASKNDDNTYTLSVDGFTITPEYQGRPMEIKGSLTGTASCCDAKVTLVYMPGNMPMGNVQSVFEGK